MKPYVFQEYPKWVNGRIVANADEELEELKILSEGMSTNSPDDAKEETTDASENVTEEVSDATPAEATDDASGAKDGDNSERSAPDGAKNGGGNRRGSNSK